MGSASFDHQAPLLCWEGWGSPSCSLLPRLPPSLLQGERWLIRSRFYLRPGTLTLTLKRGYFITQEYFCISSEIFSLNPHPQQQASLDN